ncbi:Nn.00g081370.m01.CDS01 [Neocucurbitaria sp. VM-36]
MSLTAVSALGLHIPPVAATFPRRPCTSASSDQAPGELRLASRNRQLALCSSRLAPTPTARPHLQRRRRRHVCSKHVLNAQVAIRSPCCKKWFDCAECHAEQTDHPLLQTFDMTFICKKCKKAFRKDAREFEDADEYCPHCDNHFVLEARTPKASLQVEGEDARIDSRMLKDDRVRGEEQRTIFDVKEAPNKLG